MNVVKYGLITASGLTLAIVIAAFAETPPVNGSQDSLIPAFERSLMSKAG